MMDIIDLISYGVFAFLIGCVVVGILTMVISKKRAKADKD